jgi:hypothetical protein
MIPDQEPASSIGPAQARMHVATLTTIIRADRSLDLSAIVPGAW